MCLPSVIFITFRLISTLFSFSWLLILPVCAIMFGITAFSSLSIAISVALLASQLIPATIVSVLFYKISLDSAEVFGINVSGMELRNLKALTRNGRL